MSYPPPQTPYQPPQYPQQQPPYQPPPPPPQGPFDLQPNVAAMLTYLPFLLGLVAAIAFFVVEKNNRLVRFHALQSLILHGVFFVISFAGGIFFNVFSRVGGPLGAIFGVLGSLLFSLIVFISTLAICIFLMIKANGGAMTKLPIIGDIAEKNI